MNSGEKPPTVDCSVIGISPPFTKCTFLPWSAQHGARFKEELPLESSLTLCTFVMAGLDPAIHVLAQPKRKPWMPGSSPGTTSLVPNSRRTSIGIAHVR